MEVLLSSLTEQASYPPPQDGDLVRLLGGGEFQGGLAPCEQGVKELRRCECRHQLQACKDFLIAQIGRHLSPILHQNRYLLVTSSYAGPASWDEQHKGETCAQAGKLMKCMPCRRLKDMWTSLRVTIETLGLYLTLWDEVKAHLYRCSIDMCLGMALEFGEQDVGERR